MSAEESDPSQDPPRKALSPALWISFIPAWVAITVIVIMGLAVHAWLAVLGCLGLLILGLVPLTTLTEMAEVELARGTSAGRFLPRSLILAGTFIGCLLGAIAIAIAGALAPAPFMWILVQVVGIAPAAITATILTVRSHRLPIKPYSGPFIAIKWR